MAGGEPKIISLSYMYIHLIIVSATNSLSLFLGCSAMMATFSTIPRERYNYIYYIINPFPWQRHCRIGGSNILA